MELHSQTKANLCGLRISPCFVYTRSDTVLWNNRWVVAFVACDGEEVLSSEVDAKALKQVTFLRSEGVAEGYVVELEVIALLQIVRANLTTVVLYLLVVKICNAHYVSKTVRSPQTDVVLTLVEDVEAESTTEEEAQVEVLIGERPCPPPCCPTA